MSHSSDDVSSELSGNAANIDVALPADLELHGKLPFAVVGIGASAGGIEALSAFFSAIANDCGAAFVVIQHLPPDRESLLAEILSRRTTMPVLPIYEGLVVQPNHVYVTRPGHTVTLADGVLHLGEPVQKRGHQRPVDDFFRSLAAEQQDRSIAVILSGTGSNGTAGAQAIKAIGGLCLAQDPEQAAHAGMPTSLIHAGYADQILKVEEIAAVICKYIQQPYLESDPERRARTQQELLGDQAHLNEIRAVLRTRTGHDFSGYRKPTLIRRIQRRMGLSAISNLSDYAEALRQNQEEVSLLANDLMINVTGFFRDPDAWEALRVGAVQPLIATRESGQLIRAWVTACASGEEAYSLAMLITEEAERAGKHFDVRIFATDVADKSLATARSGVYPGGIEGDVPPAHLDRFFDKDENTYRIKKEIRESIVFAPQNALRDPPFSRVDICCCRNLLIYLEPATQRQLLSVLTFAVREGGYVFLGNAETLGALEPQFEAVSKPHRIYRRIGTTAHEFLDFRFAATWPRSETDNERHAVALTRKPADARSIQQALLDRYVHPTVVTDRREQAVYFHGDTQPYLIYPSGEPTRHLYDIVRTELRAPLRRAMREAMGISNGKSMAVIAEAYCELPRGHTRIDIRVTPVVASSRIDYFLISFESSSDAAVLDQVSSDEPNGGNTVVRLPSHEAHSPQSEAEEEIRALRIELQNTIEAFEASSEELKSSNEEMTSINEELQSANEELESSHEELQALNEELNTVNNQLQSKITETEATNNDLANLLSSTSIAVVFLDTEFKVRRFTPAVNDLLELIPSDIGRPIRQLALKSAASDMIEEAQAVLAHLTPMEKEVRSFSGRWYLRRTVPYRTNDSRLDGVVITFIDISARKQAEQAIETGYERLQAVIEQMPAAALIAEAPSGRLLHGNRQAAALFGRRTSNVFVESEWTRAYANFEGFHADGRHYQADEWPLARSLAHGETVVDEEISFKRADGTHGIISVCSAPVRDKQGNIVTAVATFGDITARKLVERELQASEERFRVLVNSSHDYAIFMMNAKREIISWNKGAEHMTGWMEQDIVGRNATTLFKPEEQTAQWFEGVTNLALEQGKASMENWVVRRNGTRFWATGALSAVHDSSGHLRGFVKIMQDRTAGKELEERLRHTTLEAEQSRSAAEAANRAKDEFVAMVSHELRSPMHIISLWARMLEKGTVPEKETREGIMMIRRAAHTQQQLIDDLLDVSRMSTGKLRLALRDTLLRDALEIAVETVRPAAHARGVQLHSTFDDAVGIVRADPDRIQQVLVNLLSNAIKFTPSGGQVRATMQRLGDKVEIRVADTGIGIRKDFLSQVFSRFSQADVGFARKHSGLGLGLAIAKQIVELHGGTITANSEGEGLGATFVAALPLQQHAIDTSGSWKRISSMENRLAQMDILLIDDQPQNLTVMTQLLESHGARVRAVESAAAAREAIAIRLPDVILSDIGLPEEDGYMFIRSLRDNEARHNRPKIPAIALTAFARTEDRKQAYDSGFDNHLAKPIDPDSLILSLVGLVQKNS